MQKVAGRENQGGVCGLRIFDETVVMKWPVSAEHVRDLLLHPSPPWHIVNRELVCLPLFWTTAIYTCRFLHKELCEKKNSDDVKWPVDAIAINFGQWESASSREKYAINCHAHAHFLLTLDFIDECNDNFFRSLKGRQKAPPNYLYENAKLLEHERLLSYEMQAYQKDMRSCLMKIKEMQANEVQRDQKINKILTFLEQNVRTRDDNRDINNRKSLLSNRFSYSHTSLHYSYFNPNSNMRYSYFSHTRENP
ncbi:unnamed protein product [Rotaria sordida]|uniref:Uncharacterized protein n=1 Tax=Rotaria sordida TaxID=392033 RepID=A0A814W575_9BILA|nr:unnamed protein product [Rotaria sordida]CAF1260614.1 unnamed protein product [Rotaria sordida]CAF3839396.1 unnamed protein product [Rotaria sordida]CAF3911593.1 unnamed protein product [Rotaria sordida]